MSNPSEPAVAGSALGEGGRLVLPLTIATSPQLGIGVMAKIVHEGKGFPRRS
jgi:hypothetical protein